jgi:hypothetical protein
MGLGIRGRAVLTILAAILLASAAGPLPAQTVIPITLDDKPPANPTPADIIRQKLDTQGLVNGEQWSISLSLSETTLGNVLDFVAEAARARPREIKIVIDRQGITAGGVSLDEPATFKVKEVSLAEALKMVLGDNLAYAIQADGTVLISTRDKINQDLPVRTYEIFQVLRALRGPENETEEEYNSRKKLQELIEKTVRGTEPWESAGGKAALDFASRNVMVVSATDEMQRQVVAFCRSLLAAAKCRQDDAVAKLAVAEKRLAELRQELRQHRDVLRELLVKAGTDEAHLTSAAIFAELARLRENHAKLTLQLAGKRAALEEARKVAGKAGAEGSSPAEQTAAKLQIEIAELDGQTSAAQEQVVQFKADPLLALGSQVAQVKEREQDLELRVAAQRLVVQALWEQANDIPSGMARSSLPARVPALTARMFNDLLSGRVRPKLTWEQQQKRDQLLAEADREIRRELLELAKTYPQLAVANNKPLDEALKLEKPENYRMDIRLGRGNKDDKASWSPEQIADEETWSLEAILFLLRPQEGYMGQMGIAELYPNLNLVGQYGAAAGDPKLGAALKKLLEHALAPLQALEEEVGRPGLGTSSSDK